MLLNILGWGGVGWGVFFFFLLSFLGLGVGSCFEEVYFRVIWSPLHEACMRFVCLFYLSREQWVCKLYKHQQATWRSIITCACGLSLWMSSNKFLFIFQKRKFYSCTFALLILLKKLDEFCITTTKKFGFF